MIELTSITVILMTLPMWASRATGHPSRAPSWKYCYDGRLCQCRNYLDESNYRAARLITDCLAEFGILHDFTEGFNPPVTRAKCLLYRIENIRHAELTTCTFRKAGLIISVNGTEQWALEKIRKSIIRYYNSLIRLPDQQWIKEMLINILHTCPADPLNFEVWPFEDCLKEAVDVVRSTFLNQGKTLQSRFQDSSHFPPDDKMRSVYAGVIDYSAKE